MIIEIGGFPGYTGIIPKSTATVAEMLRDNGYATAMFGKAHNSPEPEISAAGPFDHWPTGQGFQYFYGFNQGATHAPHQVCPEWVEPFEGKFDEGWDRLREQIFARQKALDVNPEDAVLTPRHPSIPAWDELSPDQKKIAARLMEVYGGYQTKVSGFGRVVLNAPGPVEEVTLKNERLMVERKLALARTQGLDYRFRRATTLMQSLLAGEVRMRVYQRTEGAGVLDAVLEQVCSRHDGALTSRDGAGGQNRGRADASIDPLAPGRSRYPTGSRQRTSGDRNPARPVLRNPDTLRRPR